MRSSLVKRYLERHNQQRIDREQGAVKCRRETEIVHQKKRQRRFVLIEHDRDEKLGEQKYEELSVAQDGLGFAVMLLRRVMGAASWGVPPRQHQNQRCQDRRSAVDDKHRSERNGGQESA